MYNSQSQNPTDQTANFFWLIVLVFLVGLGTWYFGEQYIVGPIFWVRYYEVELIKFFITIFHDVLRVFHITAPAHSELISAQNVIQNTPHNEVTWSAFKQVNLYVGSLVRYPVALIMLILAAIVYFKHGQLRFRQTYTMNSLKKLENENWPQITPVLSLNLVKQDLETGPWAMAQTPLRFAQENKIARITEILNTKVWTIDKGAASSLFALQLGALWTGVEKLPIHVKALVVIFVARAERKRELAHRLLSQISASAGGGKLDFTGVEEALQSLKNSKVIRWLEKRHAYVNTLMSSMLEIARSDGVLATAEFLWLKPVDRRLWYVMNSVGRQTAVVEVSGVFAHWLAEKKLGRPLKTPMVKEAVNALKLSLEDTLYEAEGDKWHTLKEV